MTQDDRPLAKPHIFPAETGTCFMPKMSEDMHAKRLCLKQHRLLTLLEGEATLAEFYKGYVLTYPWRKGKAFFILAGTKHCIYPITDCKFQEVSCE